MKEQPRALDDADVQRTMGTLVHGDSMNHSQRLHIEAGGIHADSVEQPRKQWADLFGTLPRMTSTTTKAEETTHSNRAP